MASFSLRPARQEDDAAIRALIHAVRINPMDLDWRRFVLAVDERGKMTGCAQLKPHGKAGEEIWELASLAVVPEWRGKGAARALIEHLMAAHSAAQPGKPLYLTCRATLGPLYERFGFRALPIEEMPHYYRRISRLVGIFGRLGMMPEKLLVMVWH